MSETIIKVENVSRAFKVSTAETMFDYIKAIFTRKKEIKHAVSNMSFEINKGEAVALLGINGAGKSTLIKMMCGILLASSGKISVFGKDPFKCRSQNSYRIGAVFGQRTQLRWDLSPKEYYKLLKEIYRIDDKRFESNLQLLTSALSAQDFIKQSVRTLSLGQRMRAELIAAFLHEPELVFLDEPTIGLDVFSKDAIISFLGEYRKTHKTTIILVTHDMEDVTRICERVIIMKEGKKLIDDNIKSLEATESGENKSFRELFLKLCKESEEE